MGRYQVHAGRRVVAVRNAPSAHDAVFEYVRGMGCRYDEITRLAPDAVGWRGAVFRAVQVDPEAAQRRAA